MSWMLSWETYRSDTETGPRYIPLYTKVKGHTELKKMKQYRQKTPQLRFPYPNRNSFCDHNTSNYFCQIVSLSSVRRWTGFPFAPCRFFYCHRTTLNHAYGLFTYHRNLDHHLFVGPISSSKHRKPVLKERGAICMIMYVCTRM